MARNDGIEYNSQYALGKYVDLTDKDNSCRFYVSYMLDRLLPWVTYGDLPITIPKRDLELMLLTGGFVGITRVSVINGKGVIDLDRGEPYALFGGLGGEYNAYYMPTKLTVANPYLKLETELTVNKDVVIIPNDSLYLGVLPLFNRYATMLTENAISMRIADINSRIAKLISAGDNRSIASAKEYIERIEKGKLGIVADTSFLEGVKVQGNTADNGGRSITQLIELHQYLKAGYLNDIGLDANYNMKRESINSTEAQLGNDALLPFIDDMFNSRVDGWNKANELFGLNVTVNRSSAWKIREEISENQIENSESIEKKDGENSNES